LVVENGQLNQQHIEQLRNSGITDKGLIQQVGLFSATAEELTGLFQRRDIKAGGLVFPYPYVEGFRRCRLDEPLYIEADDGYGNRGTGPREIRYLNKKGQGNRLYLPVPDDELSKTSRLIVTEGEKKALSLVQLGFSAIAVSGVWAWRAGGNVCPEFKLINWKRPVSVIFDSDAALIRMVRKALQELGKELASRGAKVELTVVPR
jgi:hypothetical protein